jgi:uncharacterized protein YukE
MSGQTIQVSQDDVNDAAQTVAKAAKDWQSGKAKLSQDSSNGVGFDAWVERMEKIKTLVESCKSLITADMTAIEKATAQVADTDSDSARHMAGE